VRNIIRVIVWGALLFAAGLVVNHTLRETDIVVDEETFRFEQAQQDAVPAGNHVVYSRHIVDNSGRPRWNARLQPWKTLPSSPVTGAPLQVVFLHGDNTTFAESIARGNYLSRLVRQWTPPPGPNSALDFHTFSWRADFGAERFHTAELAATAQAEGLADFLKSLNRPAAAAPRVVVITHSLGARLLLAALAKHGADAGFPKLAGVIMVQAAVPRTAVSRGTFETFRNDTVNSQRYDGEFYPALSRAGPVLATCSAADTVLGRHFYADPGIADAASAPKLHSALGQPYASATEVEQFPENFRLLDFSPGRYPDLALPSHESLYDASGRRAFWSLWNQLLRQNGPLRAN
jgi:predicted alpha/beta hydrolase family esterase